MSKPLIILDRDGVINYDTGLYVKSEEEWLAIESSLRAIANLTRSGYKTALALTGKGQKTLSSPVFDDLLSFTKHILSQP
jgi:D-glycero-D-manno-heptose 1,7-bisphosphate phosphatase